MTVMRTVLSYLRPYRLRFTIALIGMGIFTFISVTPPLLLRYLLDGVVAVQAWHLLTGAVVLMVAIPIAGELLRFVNMRLVIYTSRRFIADIRLALYRKVLRLSLRYHGENTAGAMVGRIMDDTNMLLMMLTGDTVRLVVDVIVFAFSISVMFTLSPANGGIFLGLLVLYVVAYHVFSKRIRSSTEEYRAIYDQITGRLQETVAGVRLVRIYNRENWENTQFLGRTSDSLTKQLSTRMSSVNLSTVCTAIAGFGSAGIAGLAAYYVLTGRISFGDYLAINSYVWMSITPIIRITTIAAQLSETWVSVDRIAEVLNEKEDITSKTDAPPMPAISGRVEFRDVYFAYEANNPLYRGLSLSIAPGMTVALVGPTGCGKTTLTALLMRYWDIQKGSILVDGLDIRDVELKSLRRQFGVVLQDPVVFDGTLAENIAYGRPWASREKVEQAARAAEIYELAVGLPEGFDTVIGMEGLKLSMGEKQRVSIARAILKDPAVLIMDEATSSLDSRSEVLIQRALTRVLKNRTSFVVAHRLSTITSADMIVVMDQGSIVEKGTHEELMGLDEGLYQRLYNELLGGAMEEDS